MADIVTEIEVIAAPTGYDKTEYQFFRNNSTGHLWKASAIMQPAHAPMINGDIEAAPTQIAVQVTVSPIDEDGKALREGDKPIIIDTHSHTFNETEMSEEDFDPTQRIMGIVAQRIHVGEARLSGMEKLTAMTEAWNKKAKLKTGKVTYTESDEARAAMTGPTVIQPNGELVRAAAPLVGFSDGSTIEAPRPQGATPSEVAPDSETPL